MKCKQQKRVHPNSTRDSSHLLASKKRITNLKKSKKNRQRKLSRITIKSKKKGTTVLNDDQDGIQIVWLELKRSDYLNRKGHLHLIANYLHVFDNVDSYINYLLSLDSKNSKQKLLLVISGTQGRKILPLIYDQIQILYIYIFCAKKENHEQWTKNYSEKIKGIYLDRDELISKLNDDISCYLKMIPMSIVPSVHLNGTERSCRNLHEEQTSFMWYQLLIEILKRMPLTSLSRNDLLNECRMEYSTDKKELEKIEEFAKTYQSNNVIQWYTRDAFLYRLLNKALRTQDILPIYQFRFVLIDLHNRLAQLHKQYIQSLQADKESPSELTVFRGQGLTVEELKIFQQNIGKRIAMNSFLSTSISSDVALSFAGNGTGRPFIESILFEVHCPIKIYQNKPFANIEKYSYTKSENEILFTIGTIFQIDSVEELTECIWHITLTLCDDDDDINRNELIDNFKSDIADETEISSLAKLLLEINQLDKAEYFYKLILKDLPTNHADRIPIQVNIGAIHFANGNYLTARKCYSQALKMSRTLFPNDLMTVSSIWNNIGHVCNELGDYTQSIRYHRKALRIQKKLLSENDFQLATTFNHLGVVYGCISKYDLALKYLEKANEIYLKWLPSMHYHHGETLNNIGEIYLSNGDANKARLHLEKSLEIRLKSLPSHHPILSASYTNLACAYDRLDDSKKALEYHQKSLDICVKSMSKDHPDLATTYNSMAECYSQLDDLTSAIFYHKKAMKIRLKTLPYSHPDIIISFNNIGSSYTDEKKYPLAFKYLRKSLIRALSSSDTNKEILARVYFNFGELYESQSMMAKAIKSYKKAIQFELECGECDRSPSLAMTYILLGELYSKKETFKKALIYFRKALRIGENCLEFDETPISLALPNLVEIYLNREDYTNALDHNSRYLQIQLKTPTTSSEDLATTYFKMGYIHDCKQEYETARIHFQSALKHASPAHPHLGQIYYYLAFTYHEHTDNDAALENYENALRFSSNNDDYVSSTLNNIGLIHRSKRNFPKSLEYYQKALEIANGDVNLIATTYYNIAVVHDDQIDYKSALKYYKIANDIISKNEEKDEDLLVKIFNNIARIHQQRSNHGKGIYYCHKVLDLQLNSDIISKDHRSIATTYHNLATIYFHKCDYPLALEYYQKAYEMASKSLANNHAHIVEYRNCIATTKRHMQYVEQK